MSLPRSRRARVPLVAGVVLIAGVQQGWWWLRLPGESTAPSRGPLVKALHQPRPDASLRRSTAAAADKTGFGPPLEERTDQERGIFVSITWHKGEDPDTFGSIVSRSEIEETGRVKYSVSTVKNDTNTTRIRVRLTADTLGHLITSQTEP